MVALVVSNGKKVNGNEGGSEGVYKLAVGNDIKDYLLTSMVVDVDGEITFGPARQRLNIVNGRLSNNCRANMIFTNMNLLEEQNRRLRGEPGRRWVGDVGIATGVLPIPIFTCKLMKDLNTQPEQFVRDGHGNVVAVVIRTKTDINGVPIGASNGGGLLARDWNGIKGKAFKQNLFRLVGMAKTYPYRDEVLAEIAPFRYGGLPVAVGINLSAIFPRLEAWTFEEVTLAPDIGNRFYRDFFNEITESNPDPGKREVNSIFFAGVRVDNRQLKVFARCNHQGVLESCRSSAGPLIAQTYLPDEERGNHTSDACITFGDLLARSYLGAEGCEQGETGASSG